MGTYAVAVLLEKNTSLEGGADVLGRGQRADGVVGVSDDQHGGLGLDVPTTLVALLCRQRPSRTAHGDMVRSITTHTARSMSLLNNRQHLLNIRRTLRRITALDAKLRLGIDPRGPADGLVKVLPNGLEVAGDEHGERGGEAGPAGGAVERLEEHALDKGVVDDEGAGRGGHDDGVGLDGLEVRVDAVFELGCGGVDAERAGFWGGDAAGAEAGEDVVGAGEEFDFARGGLVGMRRGEGERGGRTR